MRAAVPRRRRHAEPDAPRPAVWVTGAASMAEAVNVRRARNGVRAAVARVRQAARHVRDYRDAAIGPAPRRSCPNDRGGATRALVFDRCSCA